MKTSISEVARRIWDMLVHPQVRLAADFPLTGKKLGKAYFIGVFYFFLGSFLPALVFLCGVMLLIKFGDPSNVMQWIEPLFDAKGRPTVEFTVGMAVVTFLSGFLLQMRYFSQHLRKSGHSLLGSIGLNLRPLAGSWWGATLWALVWRVGVACAVWYVIDKAVTNIVTVPLQPTGELATQAAGWTLVVYWLLATILAPMFEEIMFRGVLYQSLRTTFRQERIPWWIGGNARRADIWAMLFSSALFSVQHLQFHPVHLTMLFLMGCFMCELYRRTGTLWTGIAFHAVNNGIVVLLLAFSQH